MTRLGELDLKDAAKQAAGNWQRFSCFVWYRDQELKKPDDWAVIYTHNRDSGLLDQSNAAVIRKAMSPVLGTRLPSCSVSQCKFCNGGGGANQFPAAVL